MRRNPHLFWLLGCLILGIWLRIAGVGFNNLWFDEAFSRNVALTNNISSIVTQGVAGDVHPPLYFVLLALWVRLVGDSVVALRMLSVLFAMLTLPAVYHLTRLLFNPRAGRIALLLVAITPFQIYYAHEARQYMLSVLCTAFIGVGLAAMLNNKRYGILLYVIAAVAGLYTHYFIGFVLVVIQFWLLLYPRTRQQWKKWALAQLVIVVLFLPQAYLFLQQAKTVLNSFWIARPNPAAPITTLAFLNFATTLASPLLRIIGIVLTILVIVLASLDLLRQTPSKVKQATHLCLLILFVPILVVLIISFGRSSIYLDRSFGMLSPFLTILIAAGVDRARKFSPEPILTGGLGLLMILCVAGSLVTHDEGKPPFQATAAFLKANLQSPTEKVLFLHDSAYLPMMYYQPSLAPQSELLDLDDKSWLGARSWGIFGVKRVDRNHAIEEAMQSHQRFWAVLTANAEPTESEAVKSMIQRCVNTQHPISDQVMIIEFQCAD